MELCYSNNIILTVKLNDSPGSKARGKIVQICLIFRVHHWAVLDFRVWRCLYSEKISNVTRHACDSTDPESLKVT